MNILIKSKRLEYWLCWWKWWVDFDYLSKTGVELGNIDKKAVRMIVWIESAGESGIVKNRNNKKQLIKLSEWSEEFYLNGVFDLARRTGLEPATLGVTGRYSNQLSYHRVFKMVGDDGVEPPTSCL